MAGQRRNYDADTKAAAMAALLTGQAVDEVAKEYKIPASTLRSWKSRLKDEGHVATQKKEQVGDLLIGFVESSFDVLKAQHALFKDREWLREQSAQEMAVLYGVTTDKMVRILEAMGGPEDEELPPEE